MDWEFDAEMLAWVVKVLQGLNEVGPAGEVSYGYWEIGTIPILFEGDPTGYSFAESDITPGKFVFKIDPEKV